ncbi:MAG: hypothetical protein PVI09_19560 [Anaerolineae bacterium]
MEANRPLSYGGAGVDLNRRFGGDWHKAPIGSDDGQVTDHPQPQNLDPNQAPVAPDKGQQKQVGEQEEDLLNLYLLGWYEWSAK